MKKTVLFLILAAGLFACSKEPVQQEKTSAVEPLKFEINVADIKAAKSAWAEGDVIYVFFQSFSNKYLTLTCEADGSWTDSFVGELTAADLTGGLGAQTLTAVYFPVEVDVDYEAGQFSFSKNGGPVYGYYLFDKDREYEVDGTTVRATLQMQKPANVALFHVAGIQESVDDYTFGCTLVRPVACASVGTDGAITESVLQAGARLSGIADSDGAIFAGQLTSPGAEADYVFTVADTDKIYALYRESRTLEAGKMYNFPALTVTGPDDWTAADLSVDMGNGLKWATMNVGATSPEDYGNYYAWGEVSTKSVDYVYSNYAWAVSVDNDLTKYCSVSSYGNGGFTDTLTELESADDAATVNWQHGWRIPTKDDWNALLNDTNFDRVWTSNYNETGISGLVITSKIDGYVGNSIFLPAAGYKTNKTVDLGTYGSYWTSSLYTTYPNNAYVFTFTSSSNRTTYYGRAQGHAVRPVHD